MKFSQQLARLRKEKGLTQSALAEAVKVSAVQLKRFERGASQPTLDVIKNLAKALQVNSDELIFGKDERAPSDDLKLQFEAVSRFTDEEKKITKALLEGMILKHEAKRWANVLRSEVITGSYYKLLISNILQTYPCLYDK